MDSVSEPAGSVALKPRGERVARESVPSARFAGWVGNALLWGLLILVAILPIHAFSFELGAGGVCLLLFLWSLQSVSERRILFLWSPVHWVLLLFLVVCGLQLIPLPFVTHSLPLHSVVAEPLPVPLAGWRVLTLDKRASLQATLVLATLVGYFFIAVNAIHSSRRLRLAVNWLTGLGFGIAVLWVLNRFSSTNDPLVGGSWPFGFYFRDLEYVGLLEMILPLPLALIFTGGARRDQSILYGFAAVMMGVALATAPKSGGVMVLGAELLVFPLVLMNQRQERTQGRRRRSARLWNTVGAAVILLGLIAGVSWTATRPVTQMIAQDVTRELEGVEAGESAAATGRHYTRLEMWKSTLRMIADYPILGVGLGAFPTAFTGYDKAAGLSIVNAAHNDLLQLVSETGAVGALLLVLLVMVLWRAGKRGLQGRSALGRSVALGAGLGCFGMAVQSSVDFFLHSYHNALIFILLIALLVGVERLGERAARGHRPSTQMENGHKHELN